jgi:UDP-4-amino-4,6-dideoxy-N-acetyl-beta-L-altrosamine transaminase
MIPYSRQDISEQDIQTVADVLRSDFLTQGPAVPGFEKAVAARCGAQHAVAVNSGTSALHVACLALGVGPGDWVWTSPITFVASANCALYCGARVDFVDIDPQTYNMSVECLSAKLEEAARGGRLPKVVIPVDLCGQSCDMARIHALGQRYGFKIIEDASHAIGGTYHGEPVGSGRYSDITVLSFHPVKMITTGEGGMALTNDVELAWRMGNFRTHGVTRDPGRFSHTTGNAVPAADPPPWYYEQVVLGFNYRMTDIHAALGTSQLTRLDAFVERRNALARQYDEQLVGLPLQPPTVELHNHSTFHLYVVRLRPDQSACTHRELFESLRNQGFGVNLHYMPVYLQPYYRNMGFEPGLCPEGERYAQEAISLPLFQSMAEEDLARVVEVIRVATTEGAPRSAE